MEELINDCVATRIRQPASVALPPGKIDWLIAFTYLERPGRAPQHSAASSRRESMVDTYYWLRTDPHFTKKRTPKNRLQLIQQDIEDVGNWVLSSSICSWGEPLLERFTLAVFLQLDPTLRTDQSRWRYASATPGFPGVGT